MVNKIYLLISLAWLLIAGIAGAQDKVGKTWEFEEQPLQKGWDQSRLDSLHKFILDSTQFTSYMIVRRGKIIFSYGDLEENSYIASCRKSILSILYGPYIQSGVIKLDQTLEDLHMDDKGGLLPQEKQATVRDIISARSGVFHAAANTGDYLAYAPKRGSVKPGEYWLYSNWDFNAAGAIFEKLTRQNIYDALEKMLVIPLQMQDWNRSVQQKEGDTSKSTYMSYPIWFSARDMAKVGVLMLNKGNWQGKQLFPETWMDEMVKPKTNWTEVDEHIPAYRGSDFHLGYGYMWWLWQDMKDPKFKDGYSAFGALGQGISVFPAIDAVIVYKTKAAYERSTHHPVVFRSLQIAMQAFTNP